MTTKTVVAGVMVVTVALNILLSYNQIPGTVSCEVRQKIQDIVASSTDATQ